MCFAALYYYHTAVGDNCESPDSVSVETSVAGASLDRAADDN